MWTLGAGGLLTESACSAEQPGGAFNFVQISDSHIGFHRPENPDVAGTLKKTVDRINGLKTQPAFVVHTGDVTQLSKPSQFGTAKDILSALKAPVITLPGEHDVIGGPKEFFSAFSRKDAPDGWFSFDQGGAHFVAIVNVFDFEVMGKMGQKQLDWMKNDLSTVKNSTPVVVFGHVPMYALYPKWGWTTEDGAQALALLRRFDHVTVLNGHIHQIVRHTDGNIQFATAAATAYPQPAPGKAKGPGPLMVPPGHLLSVIGYRTVELANDKPAAVADHSLASMG